jgi:hypothetical protein
VTLWGATAIATGTLGVMLISLTGGLGVRAILSGWSERPALIGLASEALFGIAAVAFRRRAGAGRERLRRRQPLGCSGPICCRPC